MNVIWFPLVGLFMLLLGSCSGSSSGAPQAQQPPTGPALPVPQPSYELAIVPHPSSPTGCIVEWTATVNSGGWTMRTDRVVLGTSSEEPGARVFVVLEAPGPDELVTQAVETLKGSHELTNVRVRDVELLCKVYPRGTELEKKAAFVVVKRVEADR